MKSVLQSGSFILFFTFVCICLDSANVIFASSFPNQELKNFNYKLRVAAKDIVNHVLENEKKIIITVIDILNNETKLSEARGESLEEQLTEILYELIPSQVVPYYEIVSLRLEWKSRFPEIKNYNSTEKIAKLSGADWLLTGTYEKKIQSITLSLKIIDINHGDLIWDTVVNSEKLEDFEKKDKVFNNSAQKKENFSQSQYSLSNFHNFESNSETLNEDFRGNFPYGINPKTEEEIIKNPIGMVKIPEGEFLMGGDYGNEDELPDHLVYIRSFFLDKFEVTNLNYSKCSICERGNGGFDTLDPEKPVVYVDWYNADTFCKFQNKRLPTEAEWEYAARAGSEGKYNFGDDFKLLENFAWMETNTINFNQWGAKIVGKKSANQWGLFDLHGNVMEWVQNYYAPDYNASVRQQNNPTGPLTPLDEKYPLRVVRGGAWGGLHGVGTHEGVRASKRYAFVEWTRSFQIGFRCAKDINVKKLSK